MTGLQGDLNIYASLVIYAKLYLFKVNNKKIQLIQEICSKLTKQVFKSEVRYSKAKSVTLS